MSAPRFVDCKCGHNKLSHDVETSPACCHDRCACMRYRPRSAHDRRCTRCKVVKPAEEFYPRHRDGVSTKVNPRCRDCDNTRLRPRSIARIVRTRARHRAVAELIRRHDTEFRGLLGQYTDEAAAEADRLAEVAAQQLEEHTEHTAHTPAEPASTPVETPRLRTGPRRPGQTIEERLDVARCPECVRHHDSGHACPSCGAEPQAVAS